MGLNDSVAVDDDDSVEPVPVFVPEVPKPVELKGKLVGEVHP